jgi:MFS family permease
MSTPAEVLPRRTAHALDLLNFSLGGVREGLGPYLSIYLLLTHHWDQASIGFVLMVFTAVGVLAQTPIGALVDKTPAKRALLVAGAVAITLAASAMPLFPGIYTTSLLQAVVGIACAIFTPTLAAITLGVVGVRFFARRIGRNESFNHAGNASSAAVAGALAYLFGPMVVFWLLAGVAALSIIATLRIPPNAVDHDVARGLQRAPAGQHRQPSRFTVLLHDRSLLVFAVAIVIFHFANAAMLPLVGQELGLLNKQAGTTLMAICILTGQTVMVPVAYVTGARADIWGRKPIFLAAFAIVTCRGFLYSLSDNTFWLVGVQLLDGVGAGIFGALFPLVVSDLTHGTGRYNVSLGAIITAWGLGASLSNLVAGAIVVAFGYHAAFMSLGAIAGAGFLLYLIAMPETTGMTKPPAAASFGRRGHLARCADNDAPHQ